MVIFHSYVSLPEGTPLSPVINHLFPCLNCLNDHFSVGVIFRPSLGASSLTPGCLRQKCFIVCFDGQRLAAGWWYTYQPL